MRLGEFRPRVASATGHALVQTTADRFHTEFEDPCRELGRTELYGIYIILLNFNNEVWLTKVIHAAFKARQSMMGL